MMNLRKLCSIAAATFVFGIISTASGQTPSLQELQNGISIRTARLESRLQSMRPSADRGLFNTSNINISLFGGPGNVALYAGSEVIGQQNGQWILTQATDQLPPVPGFNHQILPPMIPGVDESLLDIRVAMLKEHTAKLKTTDQVPAVPDVPLKVTSEVPAEVDSPVIIGSNDSQTYVFRHRRIFLKQDIAQSGWRHIDPATLRQNPPEDPNDGVPPPAPAPEPVD